MTSNMRRTMRAAAAGMGALAIVAGTAACGGLLGGDDEAGTSTEETGQDGADAPEPDEDGSDTEEGSDDSEQSEDTASEEEAEKTEDAEDPQESEDGEDAAAGEELSEEDLTAAGDVFFTFIMAAAEKNGEDACALITNPNTGDPLEGEQLSDCAEGFEGEAEEQDIDPSMADSLDRSMIEAADNGDGTASVTMVGQDSGFTYIKADDGNWYIDGSSVF